MPASAPSRAASDGRTLLQREDLIARRSFRAMNTTFEITLGDCAGGDRLASAEHFVRSFERRFSRFLPDSELSWLNARAGTSTTVSGEMLHILAACIRLHDLTAGIFNPTIIDALEHAGYDRSFELIHDRAGDAPIASISRAPALGNIILDRDRSEVKLPPAMRLDLGGIGKGVCADAVADLLAGDGPFLISAGGDLVARGDGPYGDGWLVAVTSDLHRAEIGRVILHDEAIATSTVHRRRWSRNGEQQHHLIDPRTGAPSMSGVASATVIAPTATEADVFAKTILILGANEGMAFARRQHAEALVVLDEGAIVTTPGWPGSSGG